MFTETDSIYLNAFITQSIFSTGGGLTVTLLFLNKNQFFRYISMIILQESGTDQTFKFIPRSYTMDSMVITQEGVDTGTTYTVSGTRVDYNGNADSTGTYLSVTDTVSLKEGNFYSLEVKNGSDVIYKDKIFCTNQTVSSYSVNNGQYTSNTSNNDFIIL